MAERAVTLHEAGPAIVATWADLDAADTGEPVALAGYPRKTIQIIGGTTVDIEGSNDGGTTWATLNSVDGTALADAVPGMYTLVENPLLIRPGTVAGSNMKIVLAAAR